MPDHPNQLYFPLKFGGGALPEITVVYPSVFAASDTPNNADFLFMNGTVKRDRRIGSAYYMRTIHMQWLALLPAETAELERAYALLLNNVDVPLVEPDGRTSKVRLSPEDPALRLTPYNAFADSRTKIVMVGGKPEPQLELYAMRAYVQANLSLVGFSSD